MSEKKSKPNSGRFKPGQSGNPGGQPKWVKAVRDAAGKHSPEALKVVVGWMKQKRYPRVSLAAAVEILDRAGSRKGITVENVGKDGGPIRTVSLTKLADADLDALEQLLAKATLTDKE